jgi:hypothetical protein
MQLLRRELLARQDTIRRIAGLQSLDLTPLSDGLGFTLTAGWAYPAQGTHTQTFSPENCLVGRPGAPRLKQSPCRFRDEFCRAVLGARGVFK